MSADLRLCPRNGLPTIAQAFTSDEYAVDCTCGHLRVEGLPSMQAALDRITDHYAEPVPS